MENVDDIFIKLDRLFIESDSEFCINFRELLEKSVKNYENDYFDFVVFFER